jgi:N-acetylmuramoyl-L-alanine amidase
MQTTTANDSSGTANDSSGTATAVSGSLAGRVVTIDAGHASNPDMTMEPLGPGSTQVKERDPGGTSGINTDVPEYLVTLSISVYLKDMLEASGAKVVMTRSGDGFTGGNVERARIANGAGSSLFVRVHCDGSQNPETNGVSTLYPADIPGWTDDIYAPSKSAAQAIQQALAAETGAADHGIVERADITGFNWSDVPSVLVETGYLTNPDEDAKFATPEYQQQVARGIFNGIESFFSQ